MAKSLAAIVAYNQPTYMTPDLPRDGTLVDSDLAEGQVGICFDTVQPTSTVRGISVMHVRLNKSSTLLARIPT